MKQQNFNCDRIVFENPNKFSFVIEISLQAKPTRISKKIKWMGRSRIRHRVCCYENLERHKADTVRGGSFNLQTMTLRGLTSHFLLLSYFSSSEGLRASASSSGLKHSIGHWMFWKKQGQNGIRNSLAFGLNSKQSYPFPKIKTKLASSAIFLKCNIHCGCLIATLTSLRRAFSL